MATKNKTWTLIQKWKEEYQKSPNGWPLSALVGIEYMDRTRNRKRSKRDA